METNKELLVQIKQLEKENQELTERRDAYIKKSEYLSKELAKATDGKKHMSPLELAADAALVICFALLATIVTYVSDTYDEGLFELISNAFRHIF
jgi:hypothetical protein